LAITASDGFISEYIGWKLQASPFSNYLADTIKEDSITATITGAAYAASSADSYTITVPYFQRIKQGKQYYFVDPAVVSSVNG